ncbi:MAG: GtrA family protein [Pseudomonadota bacterium]
MSQFPELMKSETVRQGAAYGAVGVVNTLTDFLVFIVLLYLVEIHLLLANTLAFCVAVIQSYILNNYWTFGAVPRKVSHHRQLGAFLLVQMGALALSNVTIVLLSQYLNPMISKLFATVVAFAWGFVLSKRFVFRSPAGI